MRIGSIGWTICLAALVSAAPIAQQVPASIRGRVVAAEDNRALPRARVAVAADGRQADSVFADDGGRFSIQRPEGSKIALSVTKAGYATQQITVPPRIGASEQIIALSRSVAINGRVADPSGEGIAEVQVVAVRQDARQDAAGEAPPRFATVTDDLGDYRLGGIPAGRYEVSVDDTDAPAPTALELRAGDEVASINFSIRAQERFLNPRRDITPEPSTVSRQQGTGRITGRVRSASGRPLAAARVFALRNGLAPRGAQTDAQGRFTIAQLPPGAYTLAASRRGYVNAQHGQERAAQSGRPVLVRGDEIVDGIDITLSRGTAVTGTIVDEHGEPLQGVAVRALQLRYTSGRTVAVNVGARQRVTDDLGRYRLYGLLPGSYLVVAATDGPISGSRGRGYAPVFYPGTTHAVEALPIVADLGRDLSAIDLVLTETPVARVTVVVRTSDDTPFSGNVLLMVSQRSGAVAMEPQPATLAPDGSFVFSNVPPGDYVVHAMRARVQNRGFFQFGAQYVTVVNGDPKLLTITTSHGATLQGRIVYEPSRSLSSPASPSLMAVPADFDSGAAIGGGTYSMSEGADGSFSMAGLFGPTRFLVVGQDGWYLKSMTIGGLDVATAPFDIGATAQTIRGAEVVISNAGASISGHVTDAASAPVVNYAVVVFSTDRSKWFTLSPSLKLARPSQDGSFEVTSLPPGEYWVAAVDAVEGDEVSGEWLKPETLEQLSFRARRVTLAERERYMTVLRLIRR